MKRKILLAILMTGLSVLPVLLVTSNMASLSNPEATVSLSPLVYPLNKGWEQETNRSLQELDIFEINITIANVTNLFGFRIRLRYDDDFLRFQSAEEGTMLNPPKDAFFFNDKPQGGELLVRQSSQMGAQPANGNGTLATIEFLCIKPGRAFLLLDPLCTELWEPNYDPIDRTLVQISAVKVEEISTLKPIVENYTLPTDINTDVMNLFTIEADNVVLDLNGHTINNP